MLELNVLHTHTKTQQTLTHPHLPTPTHPRQPVHSAEWHRRPTGAATNCHRAPPRARTCAVLNKEVVAHKCDLRNFTVLAGLSNNHKLSEKGTT